MLRIEDIKPGALVQGLKPGEEGVFCQEYQIGRDH